MANHTSGCDHIIDYFNGHLSEEDKAAFELHLATCAECQAELDEWNALIEDLPYDSDPIEPPVGMKERVLSNVFASDEVSKQQDSGNSGATVTPIAEKERGELSPRKRSNRSKRSPWILPAAAALLLSVGGNAYLYSELQQQSDELAQSQSTIDELIQFVSLTPTDASGSVSGTASLVRTGSEVNIVVQASSLAPLSDDEVYQVWLIDEDNPDRAGTFKSTANGDGTVVFSLGDIDPEQYKQVAISLEPDENSETPLGDVVLASDL